MAAWRYEISLLVLKNISLVRCAHSWNIFQHSKRNFVSPRGHVISSIYSLNEIFMMFLYENRKKNPCQFSSRRLTRIKCQISLPVGYNPTQDGRLGIVGCDVNTGTYISWFLYPSVVLRVQRKKTAWTKIWMERKIDKEFFSMFIGEQHLRLIKQIKEFCHILYTFLYSRSHHLCEFQNNWCI